jgi:hypothetical protein
LGGAEMAQRDQVVGVSREAASGSAGSRGPYAHRRGERHEPDLGQQVTKPVRGTGRNAMEDDLVVREGIEILVLAGACQTL